LFLFLRKRIFRIIPVYWIIATFSLIIYILFTNGVVASSNMVLHFKTWQDFIYLFKCYFLITQEKHFFIRVAWSLSYELLFYLVFALGIFFKKRVAHIIFVVWFLLIFLNQIRNHPSDQFILSPIILEFLFGCLMAYYFLNFPMLFNLKALLLLSLFSFGLSAAYYHLAKIDEFTQRDFPFIILIGIANAIFLYYIINFEKTFPNIRFSKTLILIGDASYSIYLIHAVMHSILARLTTYLFVKAHIIPGEVLVNLIGLMIFSTVLLTGICFHIYVEKKIAIKLNRLFKKRYA